MKINKQSGFTLIELVVVIIILGILAVTAAPKFLNLQTDARSSTLQGLKGALQGANTLVYSKASIQGLERDAGQTVILDDKGDSDESNDITVTTDYGYLAATEADISEALDIDDADWGFDATTITGKFIIHPADKTPSATNKCWLEYEAATDSALPTYNIEDSDC